LLGEEEMAKLLTEYLIFTGTSAENEDKYSCSGCKYSPKIPDDCYLEGEYDGTPCKQEIMRAKAIHEEQERRMGC
jgi:hypothetical protein